MERQMFGRTKIYTDVDVITADNVVDVLTKAVTVHSQNQSEIEYLWDYYKGKTPIQSKTKEVRDNINYKVNVNHAAEIVNFKRGYGFGEPIQYIRRGSDESLTDDINMLNEYMFAESKHAKDSTLAEWMYVCGVGYRMVLPGENNDEPLRIYTLDPRYTFVVNYNGLGEKPVMGVKFILKENKEPVYSVYTKDMYYEIVSGKVVKAEPHSLGEVCIFCYQANTAMLGSFEVVLNLLDAINMVESNRLDDVEQYVNSFLALLGGTIDDETAKKLNEHKMLCLPEGTDAKYLSGQMLQNDIQVLVDDLYDAVLKICGMPNRDGGTGTSGNGVAVYLSDGFSTAESHMQSVENEFKLAEKQFLKLTLRILRDMVGMNLKVKDIDIKFSRRNYDNIQTKSQVLVSMLNNPKIHPELAFAHCGLFIDPSSAYLQSKAWWEEQKKIEEEEAKTYVESLRGASHDDTV